MKTVTLSHFIHMKMCNRDHSSSQNIHEEKEILKVKNRF